MTLKNGATISYRPLDDPNKLRSNNLTYWLLIEGSETSAESFHQLKTRLRNTNAVVFLRDENGDPVYELDSNGNQRPVIQYDWRKGLVESNPDAGWIRTDLLLVSDEIYQHGANHDDYEVPKDDIDPIISSQIGRAHV